MDVGHEHVRIPQSVRYQSGTLDAAEEDGGVLARILPAQLGELFLDPIQHESDETPGMVGKDVLALVHL